MQVAEQHHQNGQADGRFRRRDGEDEEHEDLSVDIAQVMRKRDEVHVHRQQHQLNGHQQNDHVFAVEENAQHADGKQDAAQHQVMR
jgi:hypothetical protein